MKQNLQTYRLMHNTETGSGYLVRLASPAAMPGLYDCCMHTGPIYTDVALLAKPLAALQHFPSDIMKQQLDQKWTSSSRQFEKEDQ